MKKHEIKVTSIKGKNGAPNVCTYQIQGQEDQDLLVIEPAGELDIKSTGNVVLRVNVEDDPNGGVEGVQPPNDVKLDPEEEKDKDHKFTVREPLGRVSDHKIHIQCCTEKKLLLFCDWQDVVAETDVMGSLLPDGDKSMFSASSDPLPDHTQRLLPMQPLRLHADPSLPVVTGGPVMKVED